MERSFVRRTLIREDITSGEMAGETSVSDTKMIMSGTLQIARSSTGCAEDANEAAQVEERDCGPVLLRKTLLSTQLSFLETFTASRRVQKVSSFLVLTFERLCNLNLELPKLMEELTLSYLSSDRLRTGRVQR